MFLCLFLSSCFHAVKGKWLEPRVLHRYCLNGLNLDQNTCSFSKQHNLLFDKVEYRILALISGAVEGLKIWRCSYQYKVFWRKQFLLHYPTKYEQIANRSLISSKFPSRSSLTLILFSLHIFSILIYCLNFFILFYL